MTDHASLYAHLKAGRASTPRRDRPGDDELKPKDSPALPGFERIGEFSFRRIIRKQAPSSAPLASPSLLVPGSRYSDLVFFDTETTGLSGGAGNMVFLLGRGFFELSAFVVEQYFLADFPGERNSFRSFSRLPPEKNYVSYNGKAFDAHILQSRFRMNRMEISFPLHTDLLPVSRRLWKQSIGSCSLKNIETHALGSPRGADIEGWEVPERYFRFLREKNPRLLADVFFHNDEDVYSLARLFNLIEQMLNSGTPAGGAAPVSLAALLIHRDQGKAEQLLQTSLETGDDEAGLALGFYRKRAGDHVRARAVWELIFARSAHTAAGIELAKHFEHRERACDRALQVVEKLIAQVPAPDRALRSALLARKDRLLRKIAKNENNDEQDGTR